MSEENVGKDKVDGVKEPKELKVKRMGLLLGGLEGAPEDEVGMDGVDGVSEEVERLEGGGGDGTTTGRSRGSF